MSNTQVQTRQPNQQVAAFDYVKKALSSESFKSQLALAAPKHMTADRCLRVALTAALSQPKLGQACMTDAGKASLYKAMLTATQLGLEVDGRQAHLVPFNDKRNGMIVQLVPGYQGLMQLAYNHPKVKAIWAEVVYQSDFFKHAKGLNRVLEHIPSDLEDRGSLTYAYAVAELEGGSKTFIVLSRREVMKAKGYSRGADSEYSPWNTNEEAMWMKTAVRALCKWIPQSNELRQAVEIDSEAEDLTATVNNVKPTASVSSPMPDPAPAPQVASQSEPEPAPAPQPAPAPKPAAKAAPKPAPKPTPPPSPAPEPEPQPETPQTSNESSAEDDVPMGDEPAASDEKEVVLAPAHAEILSVLENNGVPVEDFLDWLHGSGRHPHANKGTFAAIPSAVMTKLLADPAALAKCVKIYGVKKA